MSEKFKGSIAQANVQFPIETVIQPIAGENYSRALIFIPASEVSTYLPGASSTAANSMVELNASNYGELTGGKLKTWLVPFFTSAAAAIVGVAVYDDSGESEQEIKAALQTTYTKFVYYAYFKFGLAGSEAYVTLQKNLCSICVADTLYSRLWVGTDDTNVLEGTSALVTALNGAGGSYRLIYNADTAINPALAQLGKTLSAVNATGTPVGNSVDMVAFNTIGASGAGTDGESENLSATQKATLDGQKIGYNTYVGDGTDNVVTEGSLYSNGDSVGAEWVKAYITYMCKIKTANLISRLNAFRNNDTYQAILLILQDQVRPFTTMGRLDNFLVTAPVFADLVQSGDQITVPNAWQADYIDDVRAVTVYGTLYITQPTR